MVGVKNGYVSFYLINFFKENFRAKIFFKGPNSMGCNA
jgi:hypothetical protein